VQFSRCLGPHGPSKLNSEPQTLLTP